jgi:streptogramin lyase
MASSMTARATVLMIVLTPLYFWPSGQAAAITFQNVPVPPPVNEITSGADGALWFTIPDATSLGRVTPAGAYQEFDLPADPPVPIENLGLQGIVLGPDGSLWATAPLRSSVFRLRLDGTSTQYRMQGGAPFAITTDPDGNAWFTSPGMVGRITSAGNMSLFQVPANNSELGSITSGPDGNLWLAVRDGNKIVRLTPQGLATEFPLPKAGSAPYSIRSGPDNKLWFTEITGNRIGRISTQGVITEIDLPHQDSQPVSIIRTPDNTMWFTELAGNRLGRITVSGGLTEYEVPGSPGPANLTVGPDGNLWFTETFGISIGRVTLGGTPGPCVPGDAVLCIDDAPGDRRFKVEVEYSTAQAGGLSGLAHAIPLASLGVTRGGLFWFFSQDNPELLVKVLDGCAVSGHRWVFLSGGTNVALIATVADTVTGEVHSYYNNDLTPFAPVQDTQAIACGN